MGVIPIDTLKNYLILLLIVLVAGLGVYAYMQRGGGDTAGIDQAIRDIQQIRTEQRAILSELKSVGTELGRVRNEIAESRAELARVRGEIAESQSRVTADYQLIVEGGNIVNTIQKRDKQP
jgi:septal ring factor EnvC (AmiA/AmiB activator)